MNRCREINSVAIADGRLELNLLRCLDCILVQAVAQPVNDAVHMYRPRRREHHIEQNFTFQIQFPRLVGIERDWA